MKVKMIKIIHIFLVCFCAFSLVAQQDSVSTIPELPGDEVEVLKDFRARLAEAQMLRLIPQAPVVVTQDLSFDYMVELRKLQLDYLPPVIRPMALPSEPSVDSKHGLVSFAYGFPRLSEGKANLDYQLTDKLDIGLNFKHLASSHREKLPSGFYRNQGGVRLGYDIGGGKEAYVSTNMAFNKNEILTRQDSFRNDRYDNSYGFNVGLVKGMASKGNLQYHADLGYQAFRVNDLVLTSFNENNVTMNVGGSYLWNSFRFGADMKLLNSSSRVDSLNSYTVLLFDPYAVYAIGGWKVKAGATILLDAETKIYPQVEASYAVMGDLLVARAFAQSRFFVNNHANTFTYNPFIENLETYGTAREIQLGGGVAGRNQKWSYGADVYYSIHSDLQEYNLAAVWPDGVGSYTYTSNSTAATSVNVRGNVAYDLTKMFSVNTSVLYRNLRDSTGNDVLGYYDLEWNVGSEISLLSDKLNIRPELDVLLLNAVTRESADRSFIDLQLMADYEVRQGLSVFVKGYNLLNSSNARWDGYRALGISAMGGVRVIF